MVRRIRSIQFCCCAVRIRSSRCKPLKIKGNPLKRCRFKGFCLVREAGVEPARPEWTLEPESSESANSTTRACQFSIAPIIYHILTRLSIFFLRTFEKTCRAGTAVSRCRNYGVRTNLQPEIATTGAQPFIMQERYGCNAPLTGNMRTGLAMTDRGSL